MPQEPFQTLKNAMLDWSIFGYTKFHDYIYGKPNVEIKSDHKPIKAILKKKNRSTMPH